MPQQDATPTLITGIPEHIRNTATVPLSEMPQFTYEGDVAPDVYTKPEIDGDSFSYAYHEQGYAAESIAKRIAQLEGSTDVEKSALEILARGTLNGEDVEPRDVLRDSTAEADYRMALADIFLRNPATGELLVDKRVAGFHGTSSSALAGMLGHGGMVSARELNSREAVMATGEHYAQGPEGQGSISFSHIGSLDTAVGYAGSSKELTQDQIVEELSQERQKGLSLLEQMKDEPISKVIESLLVNNDRVMKEVTTHPDGLFAQLSRDRFPVLAGVSYDFVVDTIPESSTNGFGRSVTHGVGEMGEFRPFPEEIPFSALPVFAVPEAKVRLVRGLLDTYGHKDVEVIPLELLAGEKG